MTQATSYETRAYLLPLFKQQLSVFKQHYTYFHTLFHSHVFPKNTNNITKLVFLNTHITNHLWKSKINNETNTCVGVDREHLEDNKPYCLIHHIISSKNFKVNNISY